MYTTGLILLSMMTAVATVGSTILVVKGVRLLRAERRERIRREEYSVALTLAARDRAWAAAQQYRIHFVHMAQGTPVHLTQDQAENIIRTALNLAAMETCWRAAVRVRIERGEVVEDGAL